MDIMLLLSGNWVASLEPVIWFASAWPRMARGVAFNGDTMNNMAGTILFGLALVMGVAILVLDFFSPADPKTAALVLGTGLAALGAAGLQRS
jgi:hypothetical protein